VLIETGSILVLPSQGWDDVIYFRIGIGTVGMEMLRRVEMGTNNLIFM
jgi:hypothetical protein